MQILWIKYCAIIAMAIFLSIPAQTAALSDQSQPEKSITLDEAQHWLTTGEYQKAYQAFLFHAESQQNALAQFTLGLFHQQGWGMSVDMKKACLWFEKAAKSAVPAASHLLAECFQNGFHGPIDFVQALHWFQQAASLGHGVSLCSMADLIMMGKGAPKDPQKALNLCQQAALSGSVPAQLHMGKLYLNGDVSIQNPQQAAEWFYQAAKKESREAFYYLGLIHRDFLNDPVHALDWFEKAASQGYLPAYFLTAQLYFNAPVTENTHLPTAENLAKAYMWLSATRQRSNDSDEINTVEQMLAQVEQIMPSSWKKDLDQKISQHLNTFHHQ